MILKLRNGFSRMSDPTILTRAIQILSAMTENVHFPTPSPSLLEMEEILNAYSEALTHCKTRDSVKISLKNERKALLAEKLHMWSYYVLLTSNGSESKARSSGFTIVPVPGTRPPLEKPSSLVITNGINHGEIICTGKRVVGAASYIYEYATLEGMTTDAWNRIASTKTKQKINNLTRGVLYYCRMGAIGTNNQLVYSDITSRTAA